MWVPLFRVLSAGLDDFMLATNALAAPVRGFERTQRARPVPPEHLIELLVTADPSFSWSGRADRRERVSVDHHRFGERAWFDVHPAIPGRAGPLPGRTLIIHHHGLGEIPHDGLPRLMRHCGGLAGCDWLILKGLHHKNFETVGGVLMADRDTFVLSLVASASLIKTLARKARPHYDRIVICGVSMGGMISLIELGAEPAGDLTVPFVAGPDLVDVMTRSSFRALVQSAFRRRAQKSDWLHEFELSRYLTTKEGPPIRPLLARSDRLFRLDAQLAAYQRVPRARVKTFEGGHFTGPGQFWLLASHLEEQIKQCCGDHPEPPLARTVTKATGEAPTKANTKATDEAEPDTSKPQKETVGA